MDGCWNLHCTLSLRHAPRFDPGPGIGDDPFYRFLQRTWMLQQLPVAAALFWLGGWPWVGITAVAHPRPRRFSSSLLALELGEVVLPELLGAPHLQRALQLDPAQLDAANLARHRLRQVCEFEPADALEGRAAGAHEAQDGQRRLARRLKALPQHHECLRHGE